MDQNDVFYPTHAAIFINKNNGFAKSLGYVFAMAYPVHNIHVLQHLLCKHTAVYTFGRLLCSFLVFTTRWEKGKHTSVCIDT